MHMQVSLPDPTVVPAALYHTTVTPKDISLGEIFRALLPFIALQVVALGLLIAFPQLALWWQLHE